MTKHFKFPISHSHKHIIIAPQALPCEWMKGIKQNYIAVTMIKEEITTGFAGHCLVFTKLSYQLYREWVWMTKRLTGEGLWTNKTITWPQLVCVWPPTPIIRDHAVLIDLYIHMHAHNNNNNINIGVITILTNFTFGLSNPDSDASERFRFSLSSSRKQQVNHVKFPGETQTSSNAKLHSRYDNLYGYWQKLNPQSSIVIPWII